MPTATTDKAKAGKPPLTIRQRAAVYQQHARTAHTATKGVLPAVAPFVGMGLLVLASAALNAAEDRTAADAQILGTTAATCVVVAVVAAHQFKKRLDDKKSLHRAISFVTVCATWLTSTAALGLSFDAVAILGILGTALSLHWLRIKRIPNVGPRVAVPDAPAKADQYVTRWDEYVGCQGGQLPGSKLESPQPIDAGWRYVLRLVPGKQSIATLMSVMILIRGGLGLTIDQDVIAEKHPVLAEPAVLLTVVTKPQIKDSHEWPGPAVFQDGRVRLGPYVDGEGTASWTVYEGVRMKGGFIQGGTNSGKTRLVEIIALSVADSQTHPTVVWYGDGQGNSSSPLLMRYADWGAQNHEQICVQFACAQLVMELRQDENGLEEEVGFTPRDDRPGLLLFLSECHKPLMKSENPERWEGLQKIISQIAREGQKVGVQAVLETQESTLGAFGGAGNAAEMIRSNLLMGNGVMMRSKDANARQVFKVDEDPSQFPELPGYGLMVAGDSGGRRACFRGFNLTNAQRTEWPSKIRWRSLETGSGNAAGMAYIMRAQLAEMAKEEVRRRVAARRNGTHLGGQIDQMFTAARGSDGGGLGDLAPIAQFPVWDPTADRIRTRDMHDGHRKVLDAVKVGIPRPTPIAEATGYSVRRVHQILDELMDEFGVVQRDRHGEYVLTGAGQSVV